MRQYLLLPGYRTPENTRYTTNVIRKIVWFVVPFLVIGIISPVTAQQPPENSSGADSSPPTPVTIREILPGGIHLLVEEHKDAPLTALEIRVRVGSGRETPELNGVAHFVEHMVFKGSVNHPSGAIDADMEKLGGEISARTTRDATHFSTVIPSGKWKDALALLTEALLSPTFHEDDIKTEAKVIAAEMATARMDPAKNGFSRIAALAYDPNDAARLPLMGTEAILTAVTPEMLRTFHQKWYRPENLTVALVGDVKPEEARKFVSFLFRGTGTAAPTGAEVTTYAPLGRVVRALPDNEVEGRELTTVLMAFRAPSVRSGDMLPVFDTLMPILANGGGGRLVNRLVKKEGIALSISADFVPGRNTSLILLTIVTRPRQAPLVEKSVLEEIKRLSEDSLTVEESERAVDTVLGRVAYTAQSVRDRAAWIAGLDIAGPQLDPASYTKRVSGVKAEELNKMVGLYLTPLSYAIAAIGPPPPPENPEDAASGGREVQ